MPDREPLPAPFPVGTRLRYEGTMRTWTHDPDGSLVPLIEPGMVVEITKVKEGRRGTLIQLYDHDAGEWMTWEETGEPVLDTTRDGYSVYRNATGHGRIIWPADAGEWSLVEERTHA